MTEFDRVLALLDLAKNRDADYVHDETRKTPLPYYLSLIDLMSHKGINRVDIIEYNKENPTCPYINLGNPIIWDSNNPEEFRITTIFDFVYMIIQDYVFVYNKNTQVNYDIEFGLGGVVFTLTALGLRSGTQRIMEIDYSSRDLLKRSTQRLIDYVERLLKVSFVIPRRCKINKEDVDKFGKYVNGVINKR